MEESAQVSVLEDEVEDIDEAAEVVPYRYEITAYGADYPVDGLVRRLERGDIVIPSFDPEVPVEGVEGFQREYVWTSNQADRFIESLLLGLPVPGIFLVRQDDGTFLVLDGQQRLQTLRAFYAGLLKGREFKLKNVQQDFVDRTYKTLEDEDRRKLDDSIIHATIVKQDQPSDDQSSIYLIFERLNTGGTKLYPHEIRVALHSGRFARLLRDLEREQVWQELFGPRRKHLKGQELILRFFALLHSGDSYRSPMKEFLNNFLASNRDLQVYDESLLRREFVATLEAIQRHLGARAFRLERAVNAAVLDSVMVGVAGRLARGPLSEPEGLAAAHTRLLADVDYRDAVMRATAREEQVKVRLNKAVAAFGAVP